jgi:hypothetical protein
VRRRSDPSRLLRWYPQAWRDRYGDEFVALLEDCSSDRRLTLAARSAIAGSGMRERARHVGLFGDTSAPRERVRAGFLLVLCAWSMYVVAGASFSKLSEHFDSHVSAESRALPWGAFDVVQKVAVLAAILVGVGAVVAIPALTKFLRAGGWPTISRHVRRATAVTATALIASVGLITLAHSLSSAQRNGDDWPYTAAFVLWAVLIVATLALWTITAVVVARRLALTRSALAIETLLAGALTAAMVAMTAATAIWWTAIAADAPWFLHGTPPGSAGSAFEPRLALTMALMISAVIAAIYGTVRAARSWSYVERPLS